MSKAAAWGYKKTRARARAALEREREKEKGSGGIKASRSFLHYDRTQSAVSPFDGEHDYI